MVKLSHKTLRKKMLERNFKQEPFAEMLGITPRHVRNLCNKDMNVSVSLCYQLSIVFDTPMESLLVFTEEDNE